MTETKSRWLKVTDSAAQATKTVVERTQTLARQLDSGLRRETLDDVRRVREAVRKADAGLSHLFDRIENWAKVEPTTEAVATSASEASEPRKKASRASSRGAASQPS